jgi:hypothetical protein
MKIIKGQTKVSNIYCYFNLEKINRIIVEINKCIIFMDTGEQITLENEEFKSIVNDLNKLYKQQFQNT